MYIVNLDIWIPCLDIPIMLLSNANIIETNAKGHYRYQIGIENLISFGVICVIDYKIMECQ